MYFTLRKDCITIGIAESCRVREELCGKWFMCKTLSNLNVYHKYSRKLDYIIDKVKFDFFREEV
jgi:hypothetical protein